MPGIAVMWHEHRAANTVDRLEGGRAMTLQEIKALVAFNTWADRRFFEAVGQLSAEQYHSDMHSSHGGIHGTLLHIVETERIWLARWQKHPDPAAAVPRQVPALADLRALWEQTSSDMHRFLDGLNDQKLQEVLTTTTLAGTFSTPYWQMIQHLVDHSSYHRGQIVTMLRQLGVTPPSTGLLRFYREAATQA
jgi:uncharacterized damage-inducible protein DinB